MTTTQKFSCANCGYKFENEEDWSGACDERSCHYCEDYDSDSDFTDCEDCGYTHLCEDKCPNDATKCHYEKWREEEEEEEEEEEDWECQKCHATFPIEDDHKVKQHKHRGTLCLRCYEYITRDEESEEADD